MSEAPEEAWLEPSSGPETPAKAEERICTCGAGHGSLEGHVGWCDWSAYLELPHPRPMTDMTLEKAQALLDGNKFHSDSESHTICLLASAYIAQAAELTRLRAQKAAADKLAEAGQAMIDFHNGPVEAKRPDIWQRLLQRFADALSAYEGAKE